MKININKKNIIQAFIVITAFICIFGYVFVNNTKILKAEDVTSTEVYYHCEEYYAYTDEREITSVEYNNADHCYNVNYKIKCVCPTCGDEEWEEGHVFYSETDSEEAARADFEANHIEKEENNGIYVGYESNTCGSNDIGPMNFYIAAFQKNLYGFSENTYFISIKLDTNGVFELEENQSLNDKLYDLNIDITASSENGSWDNNYWWSSDVDANDPNNTMEFIAYLDCNDVYTFTLINTNTGEELGSLIYTVDCILSPHDEALANHCTLTVDANLPDGFTTSDIKDDYGDSRDNLFGDFLVKKSENILSSGSDGISIAYTTEIDEYGNISEGQINYNDDSCSNHEFLYNNTDKEYYFYGFNTNPDGTGESITELNITDDTTIYAIWKPYLYNLSYYEYNPYGVSYYDPYNVYYIDNSNLFSNYIIKYNGNNFNPTEYWQDYDGISGSDFAEVGLDDDLNLPELTLAGYTFTGWDIVDPEYYYTRSYTDNFLKFIGKPNKLRNNWTYSENPDSYYISSTSQSITLIPHFEKTHEGNIKINLYVNSEKNNYTIFDDIVLDYNTLSDTADLPITVETNGQTSTSLTITIDNENYSIYGDIHYDDNDSFFIEDHNGDYLVNLNLIEAVNNNDNIFGNDSLIQIKDNNNNSLVDYISRTEILATPSGDQDMILNLYFDLYEYPQSYNIEYDLNDISDYYDVSIGVCPTSANVGSEVTIPKPTLKGYTFIGWKVNDTTQIINQNDGIYTNLGTDEETVTLTAQWQPWTVKIGFIVDTQPFFNLSDTYDSSLIYKIYTGLLIKEDIDSEYYIKCPYDNTCSYSDTNNLFGNYGIRIKTYEIINVDVNKLLLEDVNFNENYNQILDNYIFPGYEITGFYISEENPDFYQNYKNLKGSDFSNYYTTNDLIDFNNPLVVSLPDNYNPNVHISDKPYFVSPKWESNYKIEVNMHYRAQGTNGSYKDLSYSDLIYDMNTYYIFNCWEFREFPWNRGDYGFNPENQISAGSQNIIPVGYSIATIPPAAINNTVTDNYYRGVSFIVSQYLFLTEENGKYKINNNLNNSTFANYYNNNKLIAYINEATYWASFDELDYEKLNTVAVDISTITFTQGNENNDAIIDLYINVPRDYISLKPYFCEPGVDYPPYFSSSYISIIANGQTITATNSYGSSTTENLLNRNNVSTSYRFNYFYNMPYIKVYKGGNTEVTVNINFSTMYNKHILMGTYGNVSSLADFSVGNTYTIEWDDIKNVKDEGYSSTNLYIITEPHVASPFTINFDGTNTDINNIIYNGSHINKLVVDDETIWEKTCSICGEAM